MSNSQPPPKLVAVQVPAVSRDYLVRWVDLGALEGALGSMEFTPDVQKILEAVHHVLAGGQVEVKIEEPGAAPIVDELDSMLARSLREGITGKSSNSSSSS